MADAPMLADLTADDLGQVISEAFHDVNDMDGVGPRGWAAIAEKVADALNLKLVET